MQNSQFFVLFNEIVINLFQLFNVLFDFFRLLNILFELDQNLTVDLTFAILTKPVLGDSVDVFI